MCAVDRGPGCMESVSLTNARGLRSQSRAIRGRRDCDGPRCQPIFPPFSPHRAELGCWLAGCCSPPPLSPQSRLPYTWRGPAWPNRLRVGLRSVVRFDGVFLVSSFFALLARAKLFWG